MREYIDSLEANSNPKTEAEWREIIAAEIEDLRRQDPEVKVVDINEAIAQLDADGYVKGERTMKKLNLGEFASTDSLKEFFESLEQENGRLTLTGWQRLNTRLREVKKAAKEAREEKDYGKALELDTVADEIRLCKSFANAQEDHTTEEFYKGIAKAGRQS